LGKSLGSIGAGSGHIPKGGTAADGLIPSSLIFATTTVTDGWSWRSAISDAATWSISQLFFRARCPGTRDRRRRCLYSQPPLRADSRYRPTGRAAPATRLVPGTTARADPHRLQRIASSTCWAEWQVTVPPLIVLGGMQGEHLAPVTPHAAARRILELRLHPFGCMAYHPREGLS
jgi:hypothetical protein